MPLRKRYKLLLDEGLPPCSSFPTLNSLHDLKLCKLLSGLKPSEAKGYFISLSNFGENKKSFTPQK